MYPSFSNRLKSVKTFLCIALFAHSVIMLSGQDDIVDSTLILLRQKSLLSDSSYDSIYYIENNGSVLSALIEDGDTLYFYRLDNVNVSSPRYFENKEDYLKYLKYRRYAAKVYPYAKEAMRIFREAQYVTENMKKRKRKKYIKKLSKELKMEFEDPLKRLSKTQGKIMVKMIERELDTSMFELIKLTQGKFKAFYWNQSSKLYGYRLKTGYVKGQNPILDIVLQDFDISHNIDEQINAKHNKRAIDAGKL